MNQLQPIDLITITEARQLLRVSHTKMSQLVKQKTVPVFPNPLDAREKLVSKAEILALRPERAEAA